MESKNLHLNHFGKTVPFFNPSIFKKPTLIIFEIDKLYNMKEALFVNEEIYHGCVLIVFVDLF